MDINVAIGYLNNLDTRPGYMCRKIKRWQDVYYGMSLHTTGACPKFKSLDARTRELGSEIYPHNYFGENYQWIFENMLFSRHPRESELSRNWRFSQYKPLTKAPFRQITEIVTGAIFQDSNYDIDVQNEDDDRYIWSNSFQGYDLVGWYAAIGIPNIMEDPNGLITMLPTSPYYEQTSNKIDVCPHFICSKDIIYYDGEILVFKKDHHAFYMDETVIFRVKKDENSNQWVMDAEDAQGYYAHMFGKLPVDVAGGIWNTQGFFDSYLDKAKATSDDFISYYSSEQMAAKEASHPFIIMANEDCGSCQGIGKVQQICDDCPPGMDKELVDCPKCHGKGSISISPGDRLTADKEDMKNDLVKIVNPDVAVNKYHQEKVNEIYERILHALNLYKTEKAESGEAKAIDQERLYQFISTISNHLFDKLIYNSISYILAYRNIGVVNGLMQPVNSPFTVQKPTQFQIKTASDLLNEFKVGTQSQMPAFVRGKMISDYIDKQYAGDDVIKKKSDIILQLDDLTVMTSDEKANMVTFGEATKEEAIFSRKLPLIIDEIIREKGEQWFIAASFNDVRDIINVKFELIKPTTIFIPDDNILS